MTVAGVAKKHGIVASKLSTVRTGAKKKAGKPKPQSFVEIAVLPEAAFDGTEILVRDISVRSPKNMAAKRVGDPLVQRRHPDT